MGLVFYLCGFMGFNFIEHFISFHFILFYLFLNCALAGVRGVITKYSRPLLYEFTFQVFPVTTNPQYLGRKSSMN